jgi:outer membrane lipoprotein-sorting protein
VTATISFKNRLIDAAEFEGVDPLISGGTGRLWATPDGHFRIEVQSTSGDAQLVSDGKSFWAYDPSSHTVYRGSVPRHTEKKGSGEHRPPTLQQVQRALTRLGTRATVSGARPDNVGGREAYDARVSPKQRGGLFGGASLAWDAIRGVPLRFAIYARGQSDPVLELSVTDISFGSVPSSALNITPPAGARTVDLTGRGHSGKERKPLTGLAQVQAAVPFRISAPASLAGRKRQEVQLLGREATHRSVLVTYGRGPGALAVIEKASGPAAQATSTDHGDRGQGLTLPEISVGGVTAKELATPLGTAVTFDRGGVTYTVLGSVPRGAAESAARGL